MTPVVTALRLDGGPRMTLDAVTALTVNDSLTSPAAAMRCTAAVASLPGELGGVTVSAGGKTLFTGAVDRQVSSLSKEGRLLRLEARSRGALLLDNEALPCTMTNVRLSAVFNTFIAPYGFTLYSPGDGRYLAAYTVHKGQSEWDALTGYTRRAYGHTPYLRSNAVVVGPPRSASILTIGRGGYPFSALEHEVTPYSVISKVVLRDADGRYTSAVNNSGAGYYGVWRKRYVIPANEYMDAAGLDANQRIRRSMLGKERVTVTLPGLVGAEPGQEARVLGEGLALHGLMVEELTWRMDQNGIKTTLGLVAGRYYD